MADGIYQADFLAAEVPGNLRPLAAGDTDIVTLTACCFCGRPFVAVKFKAKNPFDGSAKHLIGEVKCLNALAREYERKTPFGGHNYRANGIHKGRYQGWLRGKAKEPVWPDGLLGKAVEQRKGRVTFQYH